MEARNGGIISREPEKEWYEDIKPDNNIFGKFLKNLQRQVREMSD